MVESSTVLSGPEAKRSVKPKDSSVSREEAHLQAAEPAADFGPLRDRLQKFNQDGGQPSVDRISAELVNLSGKDRAQTFRAMQQTYGNRYVQAVVSRSTGVRPGQSGGQAFTVGQNLSQISAHSRSTTGLQAKLKVNTPGDVYEQEADRVADQVTTTAVSGSPLRIQRLAGLSNGSVEAAPASVDHVLASSGRPLSPALRQDMEQRFGHDFSQVRVHTGGAAEQSARDVNAHAYTVGQNMVFGAGRFAPGTHEGRQLLAHELTHVVQQSAARRLESNATGTKIGLTSISQSGSAVHVRRFTEPGHKMIGDEAYGRNLLTLGPGLQVTFGDMVAMGDYFSSFENMKRLAEKPGKGPGTQGEVRYVLWVKIREKPIEDRMGKWYDKYAVHVRDQAARYLTGTNISHFPNPLMGDTTLDPLQKNQRVEQNMPFGGLASYRRGHEKAMQMAYLHGDKREAMEDAVLADAFASHFLTDSFSASHIRVPRASIKEHWDKLVPGFHQKFIRWLADRVELGYGYGATPAGTTPRGLSGGSVKTNGGQEITLPGPGDSIGVGDALSPIVNDKAVKSLSIALSPNDSLSFGNLVSLVAHDVEGAATVEASIGEERITLVGDKDLVSDDVDPVTGDHTHILIGSWASQTFDAATRAVKASIEDLYVAYNAGWHGENYSEAYQKVMGRDRLYTAERLVPQPLNDSLVTPEKRSGFWMHRSVSDFLADKNVQKGLVKWGEVEAPEFEKTLKDLQDRGELPKKAKDALQHALVDPIKSGNPERIVRIIREIVAHH